MVSPGKALAFQGHPEYSGSFVSDLIDLRVEKGVFTTEFAKECLKVVNNDLDTQKMVDSIADFVVRG
jgi:hypothetical protein